MSRTKDIGIIVSRSLKNILYMVSDERDIITHAVRSNAEVFSAFYIF